MHNKTARMLLHSSFGAEQRQFWRIKNLDFVNKQESVQCVFLEVFYLSSSIGRIQFLRKATVYVCLHGSKSLFLGIVDPN